MNIHEFTLPSSPGCYLFKNQHNHVIYVGKAKNIKKRVNSYFQKEPQDIKTQTLLTHVDNIDFLDVPGSPGHGEKTTQQKESSQQGHDE